MSENEREKAQLERAPKAAGGKPMLLYGVVIEGNHGFDVRGLRLATMKDVEDLKHRAKAYDPPMSG